MFQEYLAEHRGSSNWGDRNSNRIYTDQIKCWFLAREKNRSTQGKTSWRRVENQQTQPTCESALTTAPRQLPIERSACGFGSLLISFWPSPYRSCETDRTILISWSSLQVPVSSLCTAAQPSVSAWTRLQLGMKHFLKFQWYLRQGFGVDGLDRLMICRDCNTSAVDCEHFGYFGSIPCFNVIECSDGITNRFVVLQQHRPNPFPTGITLTGLWTSWYCSTGACDTSCLIYLKLSICGLSQWIKTSEFL